ncbi:MAG TPA: OsmC family protein [Devosia sp.]|jgi:organic hydroperoxide reductase OsmC/OhrA|nr:OsmC family protein [Devosia sp.]
MTTMQVSLRNIPGTQAAVGWAGGHTVVIDRPEGRAGGMGLGFNGGQMIALAIGGCFCNDLRYEAERTGTTIEAISVEVTITLDGTPALVTRADMRVEVVGSGNVDDLIRTAAASSAVTNSISRGFPVLITSL